MKVLILGVTGMLGHQLANKLKLNFELYGTIRGSELPLMDSNLFQGVKILSHVSAHDLSSIENTLVKIKPDVVINCIGVIKQLDASKDHVETIAINALFPHQLAKLCIKNNIRLFHMSTDCVFKGDKGNYVEQDFSDAVDLYGRSKFLGEVTGKGVTTLRTSIIGHELRQKRSLIEWILSQKGKQVEGYQNALYSGLTTNTLATIILRLILEFPEFSGLWHVSSDAISKYELLQIVNKVYELDLDIKVNNSFSCDRRLNGKLFLNITHLEIPDWHSMIEEMHSDASKLYVI